MNPEMNQKQSGRTTAGRLTRAVVFLLLLFVCLWSLQKVFTRKDSERKLQQFFRARSNYDVLFLGISHMECGIYPMDLWRDFGLTSFNFGRAGSRIPFSYWTLKNALDYTSPSLVVVDVRRMDITYKRTTKTVRSNYDYFPLSVNKWKAVKDLLEDWTEQVSYLFPLTMYHGRWTELTKKDFEINAVRISQGALQYAGGELTVEIPEEWTRIPDEDALEPGPVGEEYLRKTIELCKERGIEVLLVELPYPASEKDQRYANGVQAIADEYGVEYLNFHHMEDIVNFDTDLQDATHLNDSGARKVTNAVGEFIRGHYDLPDERDNPDFEDWKENYADYVRYQFNRIRRQEKPDAFLMLLSDPEADIYIHIRENAAALKDPRIVSLIRNISTGEDLQKLDQAAEQGSAYRALICNREGQIFEAAGDQPLSGADLPYELPGDGFAEASGEGALGVEIRVYKASTGKKMHERAL